MRKAGIVRVGFARTRCVQARQARQAGIELRTRWQRGRRSFRWRSRTRPFLAAGLLSKPLRNEGGLGALSLGAARLPLPGAGRGTAPASGRKGAPAFCAASIARNFDAATASPSPRVGEREARSAQGEGLVALLPQRLLQKPPQRGRSRPGASAEGPPSSLPYRPEPDIPFAVLRATKSEPLTSRERKATLPACPPTSR